MIDRIGSLIFSVMILFCFSCGSGEEDTSKSNHTDSIKIEKKVSDSSQNMNPVSPKSDSAKMISLPGKTSSSSDLSMKIFRNTEMLGFGYDIYRGSKAYIHQPNIPAIPGNNGFSTESDAKKVASLVIYKIKNNILPPTIEVRELDSLGIIK